LWPQLSIRQGQGREAAIVLAEGASDSVLDAQLTHHLGFGVARRVGGQAPDNEPPDEAPLLWPAFVVRVVLPPSTVGSSVLAAWACGYRRALVHRGCGSVGIGADAVVHDGIWPVDRHLHRLGPPILIRSFAGFFAALATKRLISSATGNKRTQ
jgi:hypothetical protein